MTWDLSSRARLGPRALPRFPGETLFDRIARVVCEADCLPRKELYESWEVARRVRRRFRGGRVVDLAGGHGLLALLCLVLDDSSRSALVVDRKLPTSAAKLASAFVAAWPRLGTRVSYVTADVAEVLTGGDDLLVSVHACGALTDAVLDLALSSGTRIAVMPCCHDARTNDLGGLGGWMDPSLAIDVVRADRLRRAGYTVVTQTIHPGITEKRRLLMGSPAAILPRVACLPVRK